MFERILRKVHCEPWLITPAMHKQISQALSRRLAGEMAFDLEEFMGDTPQAETIDGVRVIPIYGVVSKDISKLEKACGACDVREIEADIQDALFDPEVYAVVLDIDSPGGTVSGVPELATAIQGARALKPIIAYTDGLTASAAYWIAAGATAIYCTESAELGSIGVYLPLYDETQAYAAEGVKVDLVKTGEHKGAGYPGTPVTEEQRAEFQRGVDYVFGLFAGHVERNRKATREVMDGRCFYGGEAVALGLADSVVAGIDAAIRDAAALGGASN